MIVSFGMVTDIGAGFRQALFFKRWRHIKEALANINVDIYPINAMITIGHLPRAQEIIGVDGNAFVVKYDIPISEFQDLLIEQRNDEILFTIYKTIEIAFENYKIPMPKEINNVFNLSKHPGTHNLKAIRPTQNPDQTN